MTWHMTITAAILAGLAATAAAAQEKQLPQAVFEDGFKKADCIVTPEEAKEMETFDLGGGQTLFIVPCWRAAYQNGGIVFAMDAAGNARLLTFQVWDGKAMTPMLALTEPDYDAEKKTLNSFHKGRGIGDCGSMGEWAWTGTDFRMKAYYYKEKCDEQPFNGERRWQVFPRRQ